MRPLLGSVTPAQRSPRGIGLALAVTAVGIALTVLIVLGSVAREPSASPVPGSGAAGASAAGTPSAAAAVIDCRRDIGPMPRYLADDPCPSAVAAVVIAVATVNMPAERMVIESGPLFCDVIWEGYGSPAVCHGQAIRPGQFMHAYVSFTDSSKVAVVMLGLDLPADDNDPLATRPPWNTTLVAFDDPPAGWVMP